GCPTTANPFLPRARRLGPNRAGGISAAENVPAARPADGRPTTVPAAAPIVAKAADEVKKPRRSMSTLTLIKPKRTDRDPCKTGHMLGSALRRVNGGSLLSLCQGLLTCTEKY